MNVRQLQIFLQVAEYGSISRAAAALHTAQPVVSRSVRLLEESLGTPLVDRHARGVHLTDAGKALSERGSDVLHGLQTLESDIRSQASEPSDRLIIGMPPSLSKLVTSRVMPLFHARHPNVTLCVHEVNSTALCEALQAGRLDLALMAANEPGHDIWMRPLATETLVAIAPISSALSGRDEVTMRELCALPLILVSKPNPLRRLLDRGFSRAKEAPSVVAEANSTIAISLAEAGMGCAVLPASAAWTHGRGETVCVVPVKGLRITWAIAYQKSRPPSSAGHRFINVVREQVASLIRSGEWKAVPA